MRVATLQLPVDLGLRLHHTCDVGGRTDASSAVQCAEED